MGRGGEGGVNHATAYDTEAHVLFTALGQRCGLLYRTSTRTVWRKELLIGQHIREFSRHRYTHKREQSTVNSYTTGGIGSCPSTERGGVLGNARNLQQCCVYVGTTRKKQHQESREHSTPLLRRCVFTTTNPDCTTVSVAL